MNGLPEACSHENVKSTDYSKGDFWEKSPASASSKGYIARRVGFED